MKDFKQPIEITGRENVFDLMPKYNEIPNEFKNWNGTIWNKAANEWFFGGVLKNQFTVKSGIDSEVAFRHLRRVISDWAPKHEHKEAGVAYLMSLWFSDFKPSKQSASK